MNTCRLPWSHVYDPFTNDTRPPLQPATRRHPGHSHQMYRLHSRAAAASVASDYDAEQNLDWLYDQEVGQFLSAGFVGQVGQEGGSGVHTASVLLRDCGSSRPVYDFARIAR